MSSNFKPITEEQRVQAKIQRQIDQEYALNHLKLEWADSNLWTELVKKYGVRTPIWYKKGSELKYMRRVANKVGYDVTLFTKATGFSSLKEFVQNNPKMPAFACVGILLEEIDDYFTQNHKYKEEILAESA